MKDTPSFRIVLGAMAILVSSFSFGQFTTCAGAAAGPAIASGSCLTNQNSTTAAAAGNCGGGFNSGAGLYYKFVAGTCPEFDITFNANEEVQFILWTTGCALVSGSIECTQATANVTLSESYSAGTGIGPVLTPGTSYIIEIVTRTVSNFSICYTANTPSAADNECAGATSISASGSTFNNGGNCSYTGSYNAAGTSDPPSAQLCAGSLENTQWTLFAPVAGATSFQIIGSAITCSGPVCAWQFGLFSGTCASLIPEGCISNGTYCTTGPDGSSSNNAPAGGNGNYLTTINSNTAGGFTMTITRAGGLSFTGLEQFRLVMDGNANSDCRYTISGINIQPLPIELMSFTSAQYDNANKIMWEVASEINNDYFTIERSVDAQDWDVVQRVEGQGDGGQMKYAIMDFDYNKTINYYRLKQTDFNGDFEYSKVISVDNTTKEKFLIKSVNLMGQEIIGDDFHGIVIDLYSDGTSTKRMM